MIRNTLGKQHLSTRCSALLGGQFGDEGKGKITDILSQEYSIVARYNGGANSAHTVSVNNSKYTQQLLPSAILHPSVQLVLGNSMQLHLPTLVHEIEQLEEQGLEVMNRLFISDRAHMTSSYHVKAEEKLEKGPKPLGTAMKGIGPTNASKMMRCGIRMGDLKYFNQGRFELKYRRLIKELTETYELDVDETEVQNLLDFNEFLAETLQDNIIDTSVFLNQALKDEKSILAEGAAGSLLDIDHGTYPYSHSEHMNICSVFAGLGVSPKQVTDIYGVCNAYLTRVGPGPLPTEMHDDLGQFLREKGHEYAEHTHRPRRIGWFDCIAMRYSTMINGFTGLFLNKLDVLTGVPNLKIATQYQARGKSIEFPGTLEDFDKVKVQYEEVPGWSEDISNCQHYSDLPQNARNYVDKLEDIIGCQIIAVGVGPERNQQLFRHQI